MDATLRSKVPFETKRLNMKLTIARSLVFFGIIVSVGILGAIGVMRYALNELKINGPAYEKIVYGKDLIADILPPPLYLIESYLMASEIVLNPEKRDKNLNRLKQLETDYNTRQAYWQAIDLPEDLQTVLQKEVVAKGTLFWTELHANFIPSVQKNDTEAMRANLATLEKLYRNHETSVLQLVNTSTDFLSASESVAREKTAFWSMTSLIVGLGSVVLFLIGIWLLRRNAILAISKTADYMDQLAQGDLETEVPFLGRSDEVGQMAKSIAVFRQAGIDKRNLEIANEEAARLAEEQRQARMEEVRVNAENMQKVVHDLGAGLDRLSKCNIRLTLDEPFSGGFEQLRNDFNTSMGVFQETLVEVLNKASEINQGCHEIRGASNDLLTRTEKQASALENTAAALHEITSNVKLTSDRVNSTRSRTQAARKDVETSNSVVTKAISAMERIENATMQISRINGVVDEIAFQTNLLALNAGVEAARAGDSGRGFAVVAQEVRELAQRSSAAAKEINSLIAKAKIEVADGVKNVSETGQSLNAIENHIAEISLDIDQIAVACNEQSLGLTGVNNSINEIDAITQKNAAMVEEATAATNVLADDANTLSELVSRFKLNRRLKVRDKQPEDRTMPSNMRAA